MAIWLTFNLVDCTAGRLMSLLRILKKPGGGESSLRTNLTLLAEF